jgi:hypothetical protein
VDSVPCGVAASLNGSIFDRPLSSCNFQSLTRPVLLREWQKKWDLADTSRFAHSILPTESQRPWFEGQKMKRSFVTSVSRIMSRHSSVLSHLDRFRIVEDPMCVCLKDYGTEDHLIWHCERFGPERHRLIDALAELDVLHVGLLFGICVVYENRVPSKVVWTYSEVLKSGSDLIISLSVDVRFEICFIGP